MTNTTTSLSALLSLSDTLKTLPTQRSSQVSNETKSAPSPLQNDSQDGHYGPAFVLDISPRGLAFMNGDKAGQNAVSEASEAPQLAVASGANSYTNAGGG